MDRAAGRCRGRAGARGKRGAGARERRSRVLGTGSAHSEKISGHPGLTASMGCVGAVRAHDSRCMRGRTTSGTMHEVSFLASQFERASEPRVRFIAQFKLAPFYAPKKKKKKKPDQGSAIWAALPPSRNHLPTKRSAKLVHDMEQKLKTYMETYI